jgi:hypothetical protein
MKLVGMECVLRGNNRAESSTAALPVHSSASSRRLSDARWIAAVMVAMWGGWGTAES